MYSFMKGLVLFFKEIFLIYKNYFFFNEFLFVKEIVLFYEKILFDRKERNISLYFFCNAFLYNVVPL